MIAGKTNKWWSTVHLFSTTVKVRAEVQVTEDGHKNISDLVDKAQTM